MAEPEVRQPRAGVRITFNVTSAYSHEFTLEGWEFFVRNLNPDLDSTDLDAVYNFLESGEGSAQDAMEELVQYASWLSTNSTEVFDLQPVISAGPE